MDRELKQKFFAELVSWMAQNNFGFVCYADETEDSDTPRASGYNLMASARDFEEFFDSKTELTQTEQEDMLELQI